MHKPNTIANEDSAGLLEWLRKYPFMQRNAALWFANSSFTHDELALCAVLYPAVAAQLGYRPAPRTYPVMVLPISPARAGEAA